MTTETGGLIEELVPGWIPTPDQAAVFEAAMEPGLGKSLKAICKAAGVAIQKYHSWMRRDPEFSYCWEKLWKRSLDIHLPSVIAAMVCEAQAGNVGAARLIFELVGLVGNAKGWSGSKPQIAMNVDLSNLTEAELIKWRDLNLKLLNSPKIETTRTVSTIDAKGIVSVTERAAGNGNGTHKDSASPGGQGSESPNSAP